MSPEQQEANPVAEYELSSVERPVTVAEEVARLPRTPLQEVVAFKFGGTSLFGAERMLHAAGLVRDAVGNTRVIVVVSAMKEVTDRLLRIAQLQGHVEWQKAREAAEAVVELHLATLRELRLAEKDHARVTQEIRILGRDLLHEAPLRGPMKVTGAHRDRLASFGERFSARLFAGALAKIGVPAVPVVSSDFVVTCDTFQEAKPLLEHTRRRGQEVLFPLLEAGIVPVVTGFIGATPDGRFTTLGRNSSDFSGALIAHIVDAEELVIWTDVDGIFTTNPKETAEAKLLHELSYNDAQALATNGAKVLHPLVLPLAAQTEMTIWVRNTFKPQQRGTRIGPARDPFRQNGGVA